MRIQILILKFKGLLSNCPAVRMILPAWFDHLPKVFITKKFDSKRFAHPCNPVAPTAENV